MTLNDILSFKFDDLDRKILNLLQDDSKLSYSKISKILGINLGTARNRIRMMEKKGIIKDYFTLLDPVKLGYNLTVLILIEADCRHLSYVEQELSKFDEVLSILEVTGNYDIAIISRFTNKMHLKKILKQILTIPYITKTLTNVALDVIKEDYRIKF